MNRKLIIYLLFTVLCNQYLNAQTKMLTIEDALNYGKTLLAPEKLAQLQWIKDSHKFSYLKNNQLIIKDADNASFNKIITLSEINKQLAKVNKDTLQKFPAYTWESTDLFSFYWNGFLMNYDLKANNASATGYYYDITKFENADPSAVKYRFAFTKETDLLIYDNKKETSIMKNQLPDITYGQSVSRNEFGINKGTFWNNKGDKLAYYEGNNRGLDIYPIVDWATRVAANDPIYYPFAGNTNQVVSLLVYDLNTQKYIKVKTGETDQYLTNIAWSPDDKYIFIAVLNRDQNELKMNQYDAVSGDFIKTLFEEKDAKYIQPMHPMIFLKSNPGEFVWQSRRDGYNHLYHYDLSGKLIRQLTKGKWEVTEVYGFDAGDKNIYFNSTINGGINSDVCRTSLSNAVTTVLTSGLGNNTATLSTDKKYILNQFSNVTTPRITSVINTGNKKSTVLLNASNPLKEYALGELSLFTIKNKEGDTLHCRMFKPINFDENKKYPVVVYLYGGPNAQLVKNTWLGGAEVWYHYMAEKGFVVFTLDNRGSANRGAAFEQATFRNLGTAECEDQMEGIKYLKSLKYVDEKRIGVHGWSFGGFMTISLLTRYPDVFKAGVAGGPVTDWKDYEIMYTERYMDTPQTNAEGYSKSSVFNYNQNLKAKLMLIHGTSDDVVVWQHSVKYLKDCVDKGIQLDYFVYPGHKHNVIGKDRAHLYRKVTDYFINNL